MQSADYWGPETALLLILFLWLSLSSYSPIPLLAPKADTRQGAPQLGSSMFCGMQNILNFQQEEPCVPRLAAT